MTTSVAIVADTDAQLAVSVKTLVLPSVYFPMAVYCLVVVGYTMLADAGVTSMETNAGDVIVSEALFEVIPAKVAVIVVAPTDTDVAKPCEPVALLIIATPGCEEVHVTVAVISCVDSSVNVPWAAYCTSLPSATLVLVGVVAMAVSVIGVTTSVDTGLETITPSNVAVISVVPVA